MELPNSEVNTEIYLSFILLVEESTVDPVESWEDKTEQLCSSKKYEWDGMTSLKAVAQNNTSLQN